jgi:hypothetical protein
MGNVATELHVHSVTRNEVLFLLSQRETKDDYLFSISRFDNNDSVLAT